MHLSFYRKVVAERTVLWTFVEFLTMEQISFARRLYIGGLGHSVSEDELYERFSKFGNVTETEIISRKDEHGNTLKLLKNNFTHFVMAALGCSQK